MTSCRLARPSPLEQSNPKVLPDVLPLSLVEFLSLPLNIEPETIQDSWDILKYYFWECETVPLTYEDFELFREFGWSRGITAPSIYLRESVCSTVGCDNTRPLKKQTSREVVVYTAANGVQAAWAVHLYCPDCKTDYHTNFTVHDGERMYYEDIPLYVQVGEHQFVEHKVIRTWINNMLIAWVTIGYKYIIAILLWEMAVLCEEPVTGPHSKSCSNPEHKEFERKNKEKGATNFILKVRFRHTQASQPVDTLSTQQIDHVDDAEETTIEWFEVDDNTNTVRLRSRANPGTVGTEDASVPPPDPCPSKSAAENRVAKAQFSRKRTHNEQTLVRPCGIIYARATIFGAEAVSNFLVCLKSLLNNKLISYSIWYT
ncbi:hypothetical protein GALMADRAFT_143796 [Galerina marginata CBS 339.88]|uniref:CxC5 like cysteine cluster associated with KDZ domain-containing protein n=1 Tax=Galerina marginata (strain CBS 339.88) TaxID=685588 RepID=A0A067SV28_GALM3|nr:hypothetical protein GALMADRAFT_143796 [Galerina marginata CBS 339.88]